jgi:hypothetical protein
MVVPSWFKMGYEVELKWLITPIGINNARTGTLELE